MPTITAYYGINGPVPFVDVELANDNRLYVDPHVIRLRRTSQPFADQALQCMDTFTGEVTDRIFKGTGKARRQGELLLNRFAEPWETRLGMAAQGFYGHGGANAIGTRIWQALCDELMALVRVGVLSRIEDLPLFVEGVDRDITSDITTRIIFAPLARFTKLMIDAYPEFTSDGRKALTYTEQIWDPISRDWADAGVVLPVVDGKPLLLVPKEWVRPSLLMSSARYYNTSVLTFAQLEQAVLGPDGELMTTPKYRLKKQPNLGCGRRTNILITMQALESGEDLLATFKAFVAAQLEKNVSRGRL